MLRRLSGSHALERIAAIFDFIYWPRGFSYDETTLWRVRGDAGFDAIDKQRDFIGDCALTACRPPMEMNPLGAAPETMASPKIGRSKAGHNRQHRRDCTFCEKLLP